MKLRKYVCLQKASLFITNLSVERSFERRSTSITFCTIIMQAICFPSSGGFIVRGMIDELFFKEHRSEASTGHSSTTTFSTGNSRNYGTVWRFLWLRIRFPTISTQSALARPAALPSASYVEKYISCTSVQILRRNNARRNGCSYVRRCVVAPSISQFHGRQPFSSKTFQSMAKGSVSRCRTYLYGTIP